MKNEVNLICADVGVNANKFWKAILHENGDVECIWGRVGKTSQTKTFNRAGQTYIDKKVKEKEKKGYKQLKILTSNGTESTVKNDKLFEIAKKQIVKKTDNPELDRLVEKLVKYNVHKITKSTNITYDERSGLFSTPLGIVTLDAISEARTLLSDIKTLVSNNDFSNRKWNEYLNEYLTLIPQNIGMRRASPESLFPNVNTVLKQNDILDSLESSYNAAITQPDKDIDKSKDTVESVFNVQMDVASEEDFNRIVKKYKETRKDMHVCSHLKVQKVFALTIQSMFDNFQKSNHLSNLKELWHGTSTANLLSILKSGLQVTPPKTANITGKMFGNGVYFASDSTKSLNYSAGYWSGNRTNNCYMFLSDVRLGKYYNTQSGWGSYPVKGYDSVWAKAGRNLRNDEFIVYDSSQCNLTYLIEFGS